MIGNDEIETLARAHVDDLWKDADKVKKDRSLVRWQADEITRLTKRVRELEGRISKAIAYDRNDGLSIEQAWYAVMDILQETKQ